jgi:hypothetical protein
LEISVLLPVLVSLLVAFTSAFVAWQSSKRSNETALQLEKLQDQRNEQNVFRGMAHQRAQVLSQGSAFIQHIRDDIRDLGRTPDGEDCAHLLESISHGCDQIVDLYANNHTILPDKERRLMHDLKNKAKTVMTACHRSRGHPEEIDGLVALSDSLALAQDSIIAECEKWQEAAISGNESDALTAP